MNRRQPLLLWEGRTPVWDPWPWYTCRINTPSYTDVLLARNDPAAFLRVVVAEPYAPNPIYIVRWGATYFAMVGVIAFIGVIGHWVPQAVSPQAVLLTQMTLLVAPVALLGGRAHAGRRAETMELAYIAQQGSEEQVRASQKWQHDGRPHRHALNLFLLGIAVLWATGFGPSLAHEGRVTAMASIVFCADVALVPYATRAHFRMKMEWARCQALGWDLTRKHLPWPSHLGDDPKKS